MATSKNLNLKINVWRQTGPKDKGRFETYDAKDISPDMSFLEMLDVVNERLLGEGKDPIAFDHDCREGICGACSLMIDGRPHGPSNATTTCQLHMRSFQDGAEIVIEPFRASAFPVLRDLCVDRSSFDRIIEAGGYISVRTGSAPDANEIPIPKPKAEAAMDAAACIGCGACVAACPNGSAMLFTAAKVSHLAHLPQGQPERFRRVKRMMAVHDAAGFGGCSNHFECEAACPKQISVTNIALLNRDLLRATVVEPEEVERSGGGV